MKFRAVFALLPALCSAPLWSVSSPIFSITEDLNVFTNSAVVLEYDTNVFLQDQGEESDIRTIFSPGLELQYGSLSPFTASLLARANYYYYVDHNDLNEDYYQILLDSTYNSGVLLIDFEAGFQEIETNTQEGLALSGSGTSGDDFALKRTDTTVDLEARYTVNRLFKVGAGIRYSHLEYDDVEELEGQLEGNTAVGNESITLPVNFFYALTELLDLTLTYRYRTQEAVEFDPNSRFVTSMLVNETATPTAAGATQTLSTLLNDDIIEPEYTDHAFFVGLRGEFPASSLVGNVRIGFQQREFEDVDEGTTTVFNSVGPTLEGTNLVRNFESAGTVQEDSTETVVYGADLTWTGITSLTLKALVNRDFRTSLNGGQSFDRTTVALLGTYELNELWDVNAGVRAYEANYEESPREDSFYSTSVGATFRPNEYLTISGRIIYQTFEAEDAVRNTTGPGFRDREYDKTILSVAATLRY